MDKREKGVESVPCPSCGSSLAVTEQRDGGRSHEVCSQCYGATPAPTQPESESTESEPKAEVAQEIPAQRERGTRTRDLDQG